VDEVLLALPQAKPHPPIILARKLDKDKFIFLERA